MPNRAIAVHEAGDAAVAFLLGAVTGAGPVSVAPTDGFRGVCFFGRTARPSKAEAGKLGVPYVLLPARLRRYHETECMALLAGTIAKALHVVRQPEPTRVPFVLGDADVIPLPPRELRRLERAAACDAGGKADAGHAHRILTALHGDDQAATLHSSLLEFETARLLATPAGRRMVLALADALMSAGTLAARQWLAICEAVA